MDCTRLEMIRIASCKFPQGWNTSYYNVWLIHCVHRSHEYCRSSKTTKHILRVVVCVSMILWISMSSPTSGAHSLTQVLRHFADHYTTLEYCENDFVTVREKKLTTNFQNCSWMFVLICHCGGIWLIKILHSNKSK
jgi:hypothetical protein